MKQEFKRCPGVPKHDTISWVYCEDCMREAKAAGIQQGKKELADLIKKLYEEDKIKLRPSAMMAILEGRGLYRLAKEARHSAGG